MEATKTQIEQLKQIELEMLIEFVKVCETHNLRYYFQFLYKKQRLHNNHFQDNHILKYIYHLTL